MLVLVYFCGAPRGARMRIYEGVVSMHEVLAAAKQLPEFTAELLTGPYLVYVILVLFVLLIAMFFNGPVAKVMREILILALVIAGVVAYFKHVYPLIWLCAAALAVLLLYRLIVSSFFAVRQARINHRIEKRALEKARMRRGAGRRSSAAGEEKKRMDAGEIAEVVEKETAESQGASIRVDDSPALPRSSAPEDISSQTISRSRLDDTLGKLEDLKDAGILTEKEFAEKKAELYNRLG